MSKQTTTEATAPATAESVMKGIVAKISKISHRLLPNLKRDRDWLWITGDYREAPNTREVLKQLGFRFSKKGHTMEDGSVSHWYHPCGTRSSRRSPSTRSRLKTTEKVTVSSTEPSVPIEDLTVQGDVDDEFERAFG